MARLHLTRLSATLSSAVAPVAQGIEQWFPKPCAAGSNPAGGTDLREGFRSRLRASGRFGALVNHLGSAVLPSVHEAALLQIRDRSADRTDGEVVCVGQVARIWEAQSAPGTGRM